MTEAQRAEACRLVDAAIQESGLSYAVFVDNGDAFFALYERIVERIADALAEARVPIEH